MFETKDLDLLKSLKFDITEERLNNGEEIIDTIGKGN